MKLATDLNLFSVLPSVAAILIILFNELPFTGAKFCTKSQFQVRRNTSVIQVTCVQKFSARCPFSIFDLCTQYRTALCERALNFTYLWYYTVQVCCPGYQGSSNDTCMKIGSSAESHTGPDWSSLSSGAYAGIAAGGVLFLCLVGILILVLYRRRRKKPADTPIELEQRVSLKTPNEGQATSPM